MPHRPTWAVLPVKPFGDAKSRLRSVLKAKQRRELARGLMLHSLETLLACRSIDHVIVVSSDDDALTLATAHGAEALRESAPGLNAALEEARRHAIEGGAASLVVLASDLPLIDSSDIDLLIAAGEAAEVVIAPDRRGEGTNALLLRPPDAIGFSFGEGSLQRHVDLAEAAGLTMFRLKLASLAFDIDLPEDWRDLQLGESLLEQALRTGA